MLVGVHWRLQALRLDCIVVSQVEAAERNHRVPTGEYGGQGRRRRKRVGKGSVSRKARSNDVCLALKKRDRVAEGGGRYGFWHGYDG